MTLAAGPTWFLQTEIIFDCLFTIVALIVTAMGWKAYKFSGDSRHKSLSVGFFLLSASYLIIAITNILIFLELREQEYSFRQTVEIFNLVTVGNLLHVVLFLLGLTILLIIYLNIRDRATQILLFILTIFNVLLAHHVRSAFYALVAALILFIIAKLMQSYRRKSSKAARAVLAGFTLLFIGEVLLSIILFSSTLYVIAECVTLLAYLCILTSQIMVMR